VILGLPQLDDYPLGELARIRGRRPRQRNDQQRHGRREHEDRRGCQPVRGRGARPALAGRIRTLQPLPHPRRRLERRQRGGGLANLSQIRDQTAARGAVRDVPLDGQPDIGRRRTVRVVVQLEVVGMHVGRSFGVSQSRSFMRALNTCDLEVPSAMPSMRPTSL
jgi:hypothetical protein